MFIFCYLLYCCFVFFKQKTAYEMRISDWSSDVCSSDLLVFQKPSARTRNSMEMATVQLGGHPVYIQKEEVGLGTRESAEDVARTLACYHSITAARVAADRKSVV